MHVDVFVPSIFADADKMVRNISLKDTKEGRNVRTNDSCMGHFAKFGLKTQMKEGM